MAKNEHVRQSWAIITGEYPPTPGGVSDYTRLLAAEMARRGERVHVFAPRAGERRCECGGVVVHDLPDLFGPRSLLAMSRELDVIGEARILVQYVPHAFGFR